MVWFPFAIHAEEKLLRLPGQHTKVVFIHHNICVGIGGFDIERMRVTGLEGMD